MLEVKGTLIKVFNIQKISENFTTKEFVVETHDYPYPQKIILKLINDKCHDLHGIELGEDLICNFNIRGREWMGHTDGKPRYFNSIECWKIRRANAE